MKYIINANHHTTIKTVKEKSNQECKLVVTKKIIINTRQRNLILEFAFYLNVKKIITAIKNMHKNDT